MTSLKMATFALGIVAVVVGSLVFISRSMPTPTAQPVVSSVPTATLQPSNTPTPSMVGWKTVTDTKTGVTLQYPETLGVTYVSTVDWPPKGQVLKQAFTCTPAGSPIARGGQTRQQLINGRTYCITEESEGAAGSTYRQYAYAFAKDYKVVILTFSLRFVQCGNYDGPERQACEAEQSKLDVNSIIDQIAQSVALQ